MTTSLRRIAVWSGPRNLSTALMRSFSSRSDCVVSDEPFYASYLAETGFPHPGRDAVLAAQPHDWRDVACGVSEYRPPLDRPVWYQKHMGQHMRPEMAGDWLDRLDHAFLVRHPARVIASYLKVFPRMSLAETGLPWQIRLLERPGERGITPPVVDAADLRAAPEPAPRRLCAELGFAWDPAMLRWPAGPHPQDGPSSVGNSLGFRLASPVAVPEPSTWVMGLAGLAWGGWQMDRRRG